MPAGFMLKHHTQLNILMDDGRRPCLTDFGLVHVGESMTLGGFTQTTNGFDVRWSSPQRLDDEQRCLPDDVYSFGCVGYYVSTCVIAFCKMLTGTQLFSGVVPFHGVADTKTAMRVVQGQRPSRPSAESQCMLEPEDDMWKIISGCWSQAREDRPTMTEVCEHLRTTMAVTKLEDQHAQLLHDKVASRDQHAEGSLWPNISRRYAATWLDKTAVERDDMVRISPWSVGSHCK
jgi:serine/threonine protein kinase